MKIFKYKLKNERGVHTGYQKGQGVHVFSDDHDEDYQQKTVRRIKSGTPFVAVGVEMFLSEATILSETEVPE